MLVLILCAAGTLTFSQDKEGDLTIIALDAQFLEGIPFTRILLTGKDGSIFTSETDMDGKAHFKWVPIGDYSIKMFYPGYQTIDSLIEFSHAGQVMRIGMNAVIIIDPEVIIYQVPLIDRSGGPSNGGTVTREVPDSLCNLVLKIKDVSGLMVDARVSLSRYDRVITEEWSGDYGIAEFRNLTPSVYQVHVESSEYYPVDTSIFVDFEKFEVLVILDYAPPALISSGPIESGLPYVQAMTSAYISYPPYAYTMSAPLQAISYYVPRVSAIRMPDPLNLPWYVSYAMPSYSAVDPGPYCTHRHENSWDFLNTADYGNLQLIIFENNGMSGIKNTDGDVIVPSVYHSIQRLHGIYYDRFIVQKDDSFGILNGENDWLLQPEFDQIYSCAQRLSCEHMRNLLIVKKDGKLGLYTTNGDVIVEPKYDVLDTRLDEFTCPAEPRLMIVSMNDKYGYINENGVEVIPVVYDSVARFNGDWRVIVYKDGKQGVMGWEGQTVLRPVYDKVVLNPGVDEIPVVMNGKVGWMRNDGSTLIPMQYDELVNPGYLYLPDTASSDDKYYYHKLCFARSGKLWGVVHFDDEGITTAIDCRFDELRYLGRGSEIIMYRIGTKWGLLNSVGEIIQPAKFDKVNVLNSYEYEYCISTRWGFIYDQGRQISPAVYDKIIWQYDSKGLYNVKKGTYFGVCRSNGEELIKPKLSYEVDAKDLVDYGYSNYMVGLKYGVIDSTGKIICAAIYDQEIDLIGFRTGGYIYAVRANRPVVMNAKGEEFIGPYYDDFTIEPKTMQYFIVEKDEKFGLLSKTGKKLITPKYDNIEELIVVGYPGSERHLFKTEVAGKYGLVDSIGRVILPFIFDDIDRETSVTFKVRKDGLSNIYDTQGNCMFPGWFSSIPAFNGTCAVVLGSNAKFGMINAKGDTIAPFQYSHISYIPGNSHFMIYEGGKEGLMDSTGKERIKPIYENLKLYEDNFIAVKYNGVYGFIDGTNELVVDYQYEKVKDVRGNFVVIRKDGKYGVVDRKGNEILSAVFDEDIQLYELMTNGFLPVTSNGKHGLIDSAMHMIAEPVHSAPVVYLPGKKFYAVKRGLLYGVIDLNGKEVIPCLYPALQGAYFAESGLLYVTLDGKAGMIDTLNNAVIPIEYNEISSFRFSDVYVKKNCFVVKKEDRYALIGYDGKLITEFVYTSWGRDEEGRGYVFEDEKRYVVYSDGTVAPSMP